MPYSIPKSLALSCSLLVLAAVTSSAHANDVFSFDTVVVSASKSAQKQGETDRTTSVVGKQEIRGKLMQSVDNLFDYTPSVTVAGSGARGDAPINIRGITDNRVLVTVDGVKQAKNMSSGGLNSSRHFIDTSTLKQVEVIPGPASSLHGSDALGGMVAYITKDPADVMRKDGDGIGGSVTSSYDSSNKGVANTLGVAGRKDNREGMLIYTHRGFEETKNKGERDGIGSNRELPDPVSGKDDSVLGKLKFDLGNGQTLKLTGEHVKSSNDVDNFSGTNPPAATGAPALVGAYNDEKERSRLSAGYTLERKTRLFDNMAASLDTQASKTDQRWHRVTSHTDSKYNEDTQALKLSFNKQLAQGSSKHNISYGIDTDKTNLEQWRFSTTLGEGRTVPKAESKTSGLYLQDQISLGGTGLRLTPGIRHDRYTITPHVDAAFLATNPSERNPAASKKSKTSYKLGATYAITDQHQAFGQFAQGFKIPDLDQMYSSFALRDYKGIPNPDLKPESSDSMELGYRFQGDNGDAELVVFKNEYEDFIVSQAIAHTPPFTGGIFQNTNLQGVEIEGAEAKGSIDLTDNIRLRGAIAYAKGTQEEKGVRKPLDTISPLHGTLGLGYDAPAERWGTEFTLRAAQGKQAADVNKATPFIPAGYGTADLTAYRKLGKDVRLDAGVFNLTDQKYWEWETARRLISTGGGQARSTEPARHVKVGLTWDF